MMGILIRPTKRNLANRPRHGAVLFTVTIVLLLVALAAYGFSLRMQNEYRAAQARGDMLQVASVRESRSSACTIQAADH